MDACDFFGFFEEGKRDGGIRVFGAFGESGEEGCFYTLSAHESPGVGGYLVHENVLGFIPRIVGMMQALPEFFVRRSILAWHDDLRSSKSVTGCIAAGDFFAHDGLRS